MRHPIIRVLLKGWIVTIGILTATLPLTVAMDTKIRDLIQSLQVTVISILMQWLTWMGETPLLLIVVVCLFGFALFHGGL